MLKIPKNIQYVIDLLQKNGHKAYIVGGCVRDMLLSKTPFDYDITTSALPQEVEGIFEKTIPTGIKHGTVTVIIEKEPIEVTTFRTEKGYDDNRHPKKVSFVGDIKEDLARRDFTVNAMAYNETDGIIDCFGGRRDLENRILRAVGEPEKRFGEDALRILRLFRFACVLNFEIEKDTLNAALKLCPTLEKISVERISTELRKAVCGENIKAVAPLIECGGLGFLGIRNLPDFSVLQKVCHNENLAFFSFLFLSGSSVNDTVSLLKSSNKFKKYCSSLLELNELPFPVTKYDIKRRLAVSDSDVLKDYFTLYSAMNNTATVLEEKLLNEIIDFNEPYLISHLKLNGKDLMKLGFSGEAVGDTLEFLLQRVMENPESNNPKALKSFLNLR